MLGGGFIAARGDRRHPRRARPVRRRLCGSASSSPSSPAPSCSNGSASSQPIAPLLALTDGYFWRTLGIQLLIGFIVGTVSQVVADADQSSSTRWPSAWSTRPGRLAEDWIALAAPLRRADRRVPARGIHHRRWCSRRPSRFIYIDLRMRKEGLDLELIRFVEARQSGDTDGRRPVPGPHRRTAHAVGVSMGLASALGFDVPVVPDAPEARDWLLEELAKPEYAAAKPSLFDLLSQRVLRLADAAVPAGRLRSPRLAARRHPGARRRRRSSSPSSSGACRGSTGAAARHPACSATTTGGRRRARGRRPRVPPAAGDWSLAVLEQFRAMARGLAERTIVLVSPGTTAHDFAGRARRRVPRASRRPPPAADAFDGVRYLGQDGTAEQYERLRGTRRPAAEAGPASPEPLDAVPVA